MDSFQDSDDRIEKICHQHREQQSDNNIGGHVQKGEDDTQSDNALRGVGTGVILTSSVCIIGQISR